MFYVNGLLVDIKQGAQFCFWVTAVQKSREGLQIPHRTWTGRCPSQFYVDLLGLRMNEKRRRDQTSAYSRKDWLSEKRISKPHFLIHF
jgi:hypothetical protein